MWIKLGNEHLNLNHVVRVRFNRGWKNGQEDLVAEVEGLIKGEVQVFARYRGVEATTLQAVFQEAPVQPALAAVAGHAMAAPASSELTRSLVAAAVPAQSSTPTMPDM